jgi:hypothetical protein
MASQVPTSRPSSHISSDADLKNKPTITPEMYQPTVQEQEILNRQLDAPSINASYRMIFRYATRTDFLIMFVSSICAVAAGAVLPLMTVIIIYPLGDGNANKLLDRVWVTYQELQFFSD